MNVTVFSLKSEPGVYAFSINKSYIELFKVQRNMNLFKVKEVKMDKNEYKMFSYVNNLCMLTQDYLYDSKSNRNIEMITTVKESDELSLSCTSIHSSASYIEKNISSYSLKPKYLKFITGLTSIITQPNDVNVLNIDTFKLFYNMFRNTFSEDADKLNY